MPSSPITSCSLVIGTSSLCNTTGTFHNVPKALFSLSDNTPSPELHVPIHPLLLPSSFSPPCRRTHLPLLMSFQLLSSSSSSASSFPLLIDFSPLMLVVASLGVHILVFTP